MILLFKYIIIIQCPKNLKTMKKTRVPTKIKEFIVYIVLVNDYLHNIPEGETDPRGKTLGMTTAELDLLDKYVKQLISGDPDHPGIWDLHSNPDTRTKKTTNDFKLLRKSFSAWFRPILKRIDGSNACTDGDRLPLNIALPNNKHSRPKNRIAEACSVEVTSLGRGDVKINCHYKEDSKRSGLPPDGNGAEIAYTVTPYVLVDPETGKTKRPDQLVDPTVGTTRVTFTKASFVLQLGADKAGYNLQLFGRWVNTSYPELAGTWSSLVSTMIS